MSVTRSSVVRRSLVSVTRSIGGGGGQVADAPRPLGGGEDAAPGGGWGGGGGPPPRISRGDRISRRRVLRVDLSFPQQVDNKFIVLY